MPRRSSRLRSQYAIGSYPTAKAIMTPKNHALAPIASASPKRTRAERAEIRARHMSAEAKNRWKS